MTRTATESRTLRVGLVVEPAMRDVGRRVAKNLGDDLQRMFPGIQWQVQLGESEVLDPQARIAELVRGARKQLLDHGWDLLVYLTDIPMISDGRPVTAHASPIDGVGLV